jgi:hypothetical protein
MSSTRRANPDAELNQERWCSSPEFNNSLNLLAVAKRAQLLRDLQHEELVYFIQWRSLRPNGLESIAAELLAMFPERIGTPTMRRLGCTSKTTISGAEAEQIAEEMPCVTWGERWESSRMRDASQFIDRVDVEKLKLVEHLKLICLSPEVSFTVPASKYLPETTAQVWWFDDLVGALIEYRERACEAAVQKLAKTSVSTRIVEAMDFCLRQRRMIVIEGNPGLGKSVTINAWCEMHGGMARVFMVPEADDRRSFFASIAAALGVANSSSYTGQEIQLRVEAALTASGVMLVADESARLWPQYSRPKSQPYRMLWVMKRFDEGTSFVLTGFQFSKWRKLYTEKTQWPDEQFERRLNRSVPLPEFHSEPDLFSIATTILPNGGEPSHLLLVGVARLFPRKGASAMVELVTTARDLCEQSGAPEITSTVLKQAMELNHPEQFATDTFERKGEPSEAFADGVVRRSAMPVQRSFKERADTQLAPG